MSENNNFFFRANPTVDDFQISRRDLLKALPGMGFAANLPAGRSSVDKGTTVSIEGDRFILDGHPTYRNRTFRGMKIEGLLRNSRMVNGVFDDLNPATRSLWAYPDTQRWDPERNTREFVAAMPEWRRPGLLSFTINLQGGHPGVYTQEQGWYNSAFESNGSLRKDYLLRLKMVLDEANRLGMAPILGYFYIGQDQTISDESAVKRAAGETSDWVLKHGYRNVLIEINNECSTGFHHTILWPARVTELLHLVRSLTWHGDRLLAGASFIGGEVPTREVVAASDFVLMHGNRVEDPVRITSMVRAARQLFGDRRQPILFNEDDHYCFDRPSNNMLAAVGAYASWGLHDKGERNYRDGYQCPPVNWSINTERKQAFFGLLKEVTGY